LVGEVILMFPGGILGIYGGFRRGDGNYRSIDICFG